MWHFDESAAQFPAPRSEEPAGLRREIVDELADHLTCARRREQLADAAQTEEAINRRVLDRFGDPGAVAHKLWFDWMWEKIMTQRILVGVCIVMAIVSCVALGLAWTSLDRQQDLMATWQSTSETQALEQQKLFERLLAQSEKAVAAATARTNAPSDWNPVELRFVKGKEDGPPAPGIKVDLSITAEGAGIPDMEGVSNEEGIIRFPRVRYGRYRVNIHNTADELLRTNLTLQPGEGLTRTIVCPDPPAEPTKVSARIEWPAELANSPLWFRFQGRSVSRPVAGNKWQPPKPIADERYGPMAGPMIAPNGEAAQPPWQNLVSESGLDTQNRLSTVYRYMIQSFGLGRGGRGNRSPTTSAPLEWPGNGYVIDTLEVLMSEQELSSIEQLPVHYDRRTDLPVFRGITLASADWSYRIEPGMSDKPSTLWLTPTVDAIEKVRRALAEIDQAKLEATEAAEKAKAAADERRKAELTETTQPETKNKANDPDQ
jgi:hypothetical protein